ncbi:MAG: hypothetical protein ACRD8W_07785 [Nitrososphaeraceae archaeon]
MSKIRLAWQIQVRRRYCGKSIYYDVSPSGCVILVEFVTQNRHYFSGEGRAYF